MISNKYSLGKESFFCGGKNPQHVRGIDNDMSTRQIALTYHLSHAVLFDHLCQLRAFA